jgi:hypothetical protein
LWFGWQAELHSGATQGGRNKEAGSTPADGVGPILVLKLDVVRPVRDTRKVELLPIPQPREHRHIAQCVLDALQMPGVDARLACAVARESGRGADAEEVVQALTIGGSKSIS